MANVEGVTVFLGALCLRAIALFSLILITVDQMLLYHEYDKPFIRVSIKPLSLCLVQRRVCYAFIVTYLHTTRFFPS